MTKKYRIALKIYGIMIAFAIFFNIVLLGASGHQVKISLLNYLIPIYAILSILLLIVYPKAAKNSKLILVSLLILMAIGIFYAVSGLFLIFTNKFIVEFVFFALIFIAIFISSIVVLCLEVLKMNKIINNK